MSSSRGRSSRRSGGVVLCVTQQIMFLTSIVVSCVCSCTCPSQEGGCRARALCYRRCGIGVVPRVPSDFQGCLFFKFCRHYEGWGGVPASLSCSGFCHVWGRKREHPCPSYFLVFWIRFSCSSRSTLSPPCLWPP